jgi:hypothetical protein
LLDEPLPLVPEALAARVVREAKYDPPDDPAGRVAAVLNSRPWDVSTNGGMVKCRSHEAGPIQEGSSLEG